MTAATIEGRTRLFVGEGNFSYTEAVVVKHPHLTSKVIATELVEHPFCAECSALAGADALFNEGSTTEAPKCQGCVSRENRIKKLRESGVMVVFGVDATKIHETYKGHVFRHIHWNCPHDGSNMRAQTLPPIIEAFFRSSRQLQGENGHIHMALAQPKGKENFYQGYYYGIGYSSTVAGYQLIKKRHFTTRFPGYVHTQTNKQAVAGVVDETAREFVFQYVEPGALKKAQEVAAVPNQKGRYSIRKCAEAIGTGATKQYGVRVETFYDKSAVYYTCGSDEDSSGYSDIEEETALTGQMAGAALAAAASE